MSMDSASRVMSGTWLEVWLDGEKVGEAFGFQAKVSANKEKINLCGNMWTDHKVMSVEGTGTMRLYKVNSRMSILLADAMTNGKDPRFTLVAKLDDPDACGPERVAFTGVSFDDLTVFDAEANQVSKSECPFTFSGLKPLDLVKPQ